MPRGKCSFNEKWLEKEEDKLWLARVAGNDHWKCKPCAKTFDVANINGEQALKRHGKCIKHKELETQKLRDKKKTAFRCSFTSQSIAHAPASTTTLNSACSC